MPSGLNADTPQALASLGNLTGIKAGVLLPGHAREFFADASFPPMNKVSATDTGLGLALVPSIGARHQLGTAFISEVERFLAGFAATAPVPGLARGAVPLRRATPGPLRRRHVPPGPRHRRLRLHPGPRSLAPRPGPPARPHLVVRLPGIPGPRRRPPGRRLRHLGRRLRRRRHPRSHQGNPRSAAGNRPRGHARPRPRPFGHSEHPTLPPTSPSPSTPSPTTPASCTSPPAASPQTSSPTTGTPTPGSSAQTARSPTASWSTTAARAATQWIDDNLHR